MKSSLFSIVLLLCIAAFLCPASAQKPRGRDKSKPPESGHYIGKRYYSPKLMHWGYVKPDGEGWGPGSTKLVVLREKVPAPHRGKKDDVDNHSEYRLKGYFSGEQAYEPKSDLLLDVFVLESWELIRTSSEPLNDNVASLIGADGKPMVWKKSLTTQSTKARVIQMDGYD